MDELTQKFIYFFLGLFLVHIFVFSMLWQRQKWKNRYNSSNLTVKQSITSQRSNAGSAEICKPKTNDIYECWIGSFAISWSGKFYEKLEETADSNNIVLLASNTVYCCAKTISHFLEVVSVCPLSTYDKQISKNDGR